MASSDDSGTGRSGAQPLDARLAATLEALPIPVALCSRDLHYLWVSGSFASWLGRRAEEIIGQPLISVMGPAAFEAVRPYIDRVLTGERVEFELALDFPGIGERWVHGVYAPTYDGAPEPTGWVATGFEVGDRRKNEERLRAIDNRLRHLAAIVDHSDDAIVSKDLDGIVTSWNGAAERMFGFAPAEIVGRSIRVIIPPDRQGEEDQVLASIRRGERVDHFETLRRRKDGTLIPASLTVSPVRDADGRLIGASKIARDISDRKRAEAEANRQKQRSELLSRLMAALSQSIDYTATLSALAGFAVPDMADWCAVDAVGEDGHLSSVVIGHTNGQIAGPLHSLSERTTIAVPPYSAEGVTRSGRAAFTSEVMNAPDFIAGVAGDDPARRRLLRAAGLASHICVPLTAHGRTLGAMTFASSDPQRRYDESDLRFAEDVASRGALAVENALSYEQLRSANRLKDEFLATLSHELRTPLNAVVGYARMLRSGVVSPERVAHALEVMDRNATALTQIVEDVLDVSRIISGKTRLQIQPVNLRGVIQDAIGTVAPAADAKGVQLVTAVDSDVSVSADPDRLQQVIWNLLSNAVKFTPRGGRVQISVERQPAHVEIIVQDTGMGIPPAFLTHIFERFRQVEGGTTRRHGGLGLGLAIARHIVEMHGGTIHAASEGEGRGATFRVVLPTAAAPADLPIDERMHPPAAAPIQLDAVAHDLGGIHVLTVDDDEDALTLFREVLESAGAHVTSVNAAALALERLQRDRPDVLVADLGMPAMDGFTLIEAVRALTDPALRATPAAALTAYARSEDSVKALRSGFQMHLTKPIRPAELVAAVAALARQAD